MKNALLIKLSSMGDVIHVLPALTDAVRNIPGLQFDWVVDEGFAEIPTWHPAVRYVIKSAHRRWRRDFFNSLKRGELIQFWKTLRVHKYDIIIDAQSNLKSGLVSFFAKGLRCGFDKKSVREYPAHWFYNKTFYHRKQDHAIHRLRSLFAQVLEYPLPDSAPDFDLAHFAFKKPEFALPEKYLFFIPNASWDSKLWPEMYWADLLKTAVAHGYHVFLPAGNPKESERTARLAQTSDKITNLPRLSLSETAYLIQHAQACVSVDTGLSHLSAALNTPTITLYGATDPKLIGTVGSKSVNLEAKFECAPCYNKQCTYKDQTQPAPFCFRDIPPERVWACLDGEN